MRTTLNVDDQLLRRAKKLALERGVTLTAIFEEALRAAVTAPKQPTTFRLRWEPVEGGRVPDVDISDRSALYDLMEPRP